MDLMLTALQPTRNRGTLGTLVQLSDLAGERHGNKARNVESVVDAGADPSTRAYANLFWAGRIVIGDMVSAQADWNVLKPGAPAALPDIFFAPFSALRHARGVD
jgi:hypothetical protein